MGAFVTTVGPVISSKADIEALSSSMLVKIYNELTSGSVKKFTDKKSGLSRTTKAFEKWQEGQPSTGGARTYLSPKENRSFRANSNRGKIILLASRSEGVTIGDLMKITKWKSIQVRQAIYRLKTYTKLNVKMEGEGEATNVTFAGGVLVSRKPFCFEPKAEIKTHMEGTKRATILGMLMKGTTFVEIVEATKWSPRVAMEGIRLIHAYLGYGLKESADGTIKAFK